MAQGLPLRADGFCQNLPVSFFWVYARGEGPGGEYDTTTTRTHPIAVNMPPMPMKLLIFSFIFEYFFVFILFLFFFWGGVNYTRLPGGDGCTIRCTGVSQVSECAEDPCGCHFLAE